MSDAEFDDFAVAAWPRLRWAAYLLCGDHHLAEDLAQTTLARTYSAWRRVRRGQDAHAYARRVLVNLNIDRLRRRRDEVPMEQAPEPREAATDPGDGVAARVDIVRLLAELTDRERRVLVLRHYYDLSEAQTAHELGIAPGTVKSTLSRAIAKVRVVEPAVPESEEISR